MSGSPSVSAFFGDGRQVNGTSLIVFIVSAHEDVGLLLKATHVRHPHHLRLEKTFSAALVKAA